MKKGDQIAYIPSHAKSIDHPAVEFGFVYSISPYDSDTIFCRYWIKGCIGVLRTRANSEATNLKDLKRHWSIPQDAVVDVIRRIENGTI